jgi:hypothetical protein
MSTAGDAGAIGTAAAAAAGLVYAGRQVKLTRSIARIEMVYRYMDRLNDRAFVLHIAEARNFWIANADAREERWKQWLEFPRGKRHEIVVPLNVFEEMAGMYMNKILDRQAARDMLGSTSLLLASAGRTVWHVLVQIGNACTTFVQWLIDGGKAIATFVTGGFQMFIKGWQQLLAVIQPVISAIQTVTNLLPSIQMPSLPGASATVGGLAPRRSAASSTRSPRASA